MPLYGYTIGDADNTATSTVGLEVYRFEILADSVGTPTLVGTITGLTGAAGQDLEGLGTNPITQRISAVPEGPGLGTRVNNVDRNASAFSPSSVALTGTSRQYDDAGADFYVSSTEVATLYNIQTEQILPAGATNRSILYTISGTNAVAAVAGKTSVEFADALAIYNLPDLTTSTTPQFTGNYFAFASDFATNDGDGAELYKLDLFGTDPLIAGGNSSITGNNPASTTDSVITLLNPDNTPFVVPTVGDPDSPADGFDSGLALSRDGNRLIALLENGSVYEITNYLDDAYAGSLSSVGTANNAVVADGRATIRLLGNVALPGTSTGTIEYEGFTLVTENATTGNPVFTGS